MASLREGALKVVWLRAVELVGLHTARILMERACLEVSFKFYEARLVRLNDSGADVSVVEWFAGPELAADVGKELMVAFEKALIRLTGNGTQLEETTGPMGPEGNRPTGEAGAAW